MKLKFWKLSGACVLLSVALNALAYDEAQTNQVNKALSVLPHPEKVSEFTPVAHLSCRNQGNTEICWSFASSSFLESEQARLKIQPVRISVLYSEYCRFLEKTKRFVRTRGESRFAAGDLFGGVVDTCRIYGAMPSDLYDNVVPGKLYDQEKMYAELEQWAKRAKAMRVWDEILQVAEVKAILNRYMDEPPKHFAYEGKTYTPKTFFNEVVRLNLSDYVLVTSWNYAPFNQYTDLRVPDNWQHNSNFFNVPLPVFYESFKQALQSGYSVAADVDISEPSYGITKRYAFTDAPANQDTREAGLLSGDTTDDHLIHFLGAKDFAGEDWFLAKDSWRRVWSQHKDGYVFIHGSYVKLKVMAFLVHKDAVPEIRLLLPR